MRRIVFISLNVVFIGYKYSDTRALYFYLLLKRNLLLKRRMSIAITTKYFKKD